MFKAKFTYLAGLTIIELLVSLVISTSLLLLLLSPFLALVKNYRLLVSLNRLQTNTSNVLNLLKDDIRWGEVDLESITESKLFVARNSGEEDELLVAYEYDPDQLALILTEYSSPPKVIRLHNTEMQITDLSFKDLTPGAGHLPLIGITIAGRPADPLLNNKLVLEQNVVITTKLKSYAL